MDACDIVFCASLWIFISIFGSELLEWWSSFTTMEDILQDFWKPYASRNLCYIWVWMTQLFAQEKVSVLRSILLGLQSIMGLQNVNNNNDM